MKKIFSLILGISLLFGVAGSAAAFDDNDLTMVIYNEMDNEVAVNLGDLSVLDLSMQNYELVGSGTVGLSLFNSIGSWNELSMALFAGNYVPAQNAYNPSFATTKDTAPVLSTSSFISFLSVAGDLYNRYGDTDFFVGASSDTTSYDVKMNSNSTAPGYFGGLNSADLVFGEANLGALESSSGYVDMYLYTFTGLALDKGYDASTDYAAVVRLNSDGSAVLNPVPVPGSLLLLGSGLLGLFGIRRKKA